MKKAVLTSFLVFLLIVAPFLVFAQDLMQPKGLESILSVFTAEIEASFKQALQVMKGVIKPTKEVWDRFLGEEVTAIFNKIVDFFKKEIEYRRSIFKTEWQKEKKELWQDFKNIF